jgi:chitodextrinase
MGGIIENISRSEDEGLAQDARVWLTVQDPHPSKEARTLNNRTF